MKITYYDKFALTPKRCNIYNKLFWLEWYNYRIKFVGIEQYPLKLPVYHRVFFFLFAFLFKTIEKKEDKIL